MGRPRTFAGSFAGRRGDRASCTSGAPHALLDSFTHTPKFAGWLGGKLRSDYTGNICRIRRASDDAELNIGFVTATGKVNTAAIAAHCAGTTGHVVKLYDQSGNGNDISQAVKAKQPLIYTGGAVLVGTGGRPMMRLPGVAGAGLERADALGLTGDLALTVYADLANAAGTYVFGLGHLSDNGDPSSINLFCNLVQDGAFLDLEMGLGGNQAYQYSDQIADGPTWLRFSKAANVGDMALAPDTPNYRVWVGGVEATWPEDAGNYTATLAVTNDGFGIHTYTTATSERSAILVWNAELTDAEIATMDAFLVDRHA